MGTLPELREGKWGAKSQPEPTSPGRKAFTPQHCHLYKPPAPLPARLQRLYPRTETGGERRDRADTELRARLSWKDPTCLCQDLLSTGNNCYGSLELHRLSRAVVSTFLATFHQHTHDMFKLE